MNSMASIEGDLMGFRDQDGVNWAAEEMDPKEPGDCWDLTLKTNIYINSMTIIFCNKK